MSSCRALLTGGLVAVVLCTMTHVDPASALYLDEGRHFKFTGTFYTQGRFRVQNSDGPLDIRGGGTKPKVQIGEMIQWRNFMNPVFEGDLEPFFRLDVVDALSFRFAGRIVYDGIYDVGPDTFRERLRLLESSANQNPLGGNYPAPIFQGEEPVEVVDTIGTCSAPPIIDPVCQLGNPQQRARRLADMERFDPRNAFAQQTEAWEAYVNVEKGPLFVRFGRQNLAWGETDGQRLLDAINPIDRFFGLPFDEDLDEQRIPIWMIRANYQLFRTLGPLSSVGLESFWSPGPVDTTQNPFNIGGNHPFGPPAGCDPQRIADVEAAVNFGGSQPDGGCTRPQGGLLERGAIKASIYERLPERELGNGRWGLRLVGVYARNITFSLGAYRTWADIPQPRVHYLDIIEEPSALLGEPGSGQLPPLPSTVVTEITHDQVDILGGTVSFFQPHWLPGVVRSEVGLFLDEPAFVPIANLGNAPFPADFVAGDEPFFDTFVPTADYIRWAIGYDVYQLNIPWLSRTSNIIWISQWFNEVRLTGAARYRGMLRDLGLDDFDNDGPGEADDPALAKFGLGLSDRNGNFVTAPKYQALWNTTVQAFLMHGFLVPQITFVADLEGAFSVLPNVTYRLRDDLLVKLSYTGIFGEFFKPGFFRDRDQVGVRITYQIN